MSEELQVRDIRMYDIADSKLKVQLGEFCCQTISCKLMLLKQDNPSPRYFACMIYKTAGLKCNWREFCVRSRGFCTKSQCLNKKSKSADSLLSPRATASGKESEIRYLVSCYAELGNRDPN